MLICSDEVGTTEDREGGGRVETEASAEGQRQGEGENTTGGREESTGKPSCSVTIILARVGSRCCLTRQIKSVYGDDVTACCRSMRLS